ncbi:thioredoxin-dependent thiol peroxidase [Aureispira anguillae]|uniref:thioredoxin-dependent peroxiredoxin n=1 Tax=Aureispira anguillae TaxID=2864201 RepID=A0A916DW76_9BACT|nr:thioredoxin-dependent thiol peroxidase [Aureispira anguillae]BDS14365.1 thioredoxin-dependent thiol peroxidase [Aureispira anguillae]
MAVTLKEGDKAPHFEGLDQDGKTVQLSDFKGKNLILYFYPKDNTPGCTKEACNLRDNYEYWLNKDYAVVGVSPDTAVSHQKFISKYDLPFPLLADTEKSILEAYGTWGEKNMYGNIKMGVLRTTFVIDTEGTIVKVFKRPKNDAHTEQITTALEKLGKL